MVDLVGFNFKNSKESFTQDKQNKSPDYPMN